MGHLAVLYLADASALILYYRGRPSLPAPVQAVMGDRPETVAVAATTVWEIGIKVALGKLVDIRLPGSAALGDMLRDEGYTLVNLDPATAEQAAALPPIHRDPFDRALVACAQRTGRTVLTNDPVIARYGIPVSW